MKRLLLLFIAFALFFAGCADATSNTSETVSDESEVVEPETNEDTLSFILMDEVGEYGKEVKKYFS